MSKYTFAIAIAALPLILSACSTFGHADVEASGPQQFTITAESTTESGARATANTEARKTCKNLGMTYKTLSRNVTYIGKNPGQVSAFDSRYRPNPSGQVGGNNSFLDSHQFRVIQQVQCLSTRNKRSSNSNNNQSNS